MKRFGIDYNAAGTVSRFLNDVGSILSDTMEGDANSARLVVYASDEIFSRGKPILITVDPKSSAILRIELADSRKVEQWVKHWKCLAENRVFAAYLVSDAGTSLRAAQKEALAKVFRQADTFHAVSHLLGEWVNRLEASAYKHIQEEYRRYDLLVSAKSDEVCKKRTAQYERARQKTDVAIKLYDNFQFIYLCLIEQLPAFDGQGSPRNRKNAEMNTGVALELLKSLNHKGINKIADKIANALPDLFHYLDRAEKIVKNLKLTGVSDDLLKLLCLAWQYNKNKIKAKQSDRRTFYAEKEKKLLHRLEDEIKNDFSSVKVTVYSNLDDIIQSSALVETINSIIRDYLNTSRNHVSQNMLNLIMFYHNYRRYKFGKRKNKTPMELFTGKKQEKDWIELLFDKVNKVNPFLLAA